MSCLFVISSFWGYERLSNYCHVCSLRTWAENVKASTTTNKNGNTNYLGMKYKTSTAPSYKNSLFHIICIHWGVYCKMLQWKKETINGAEAEEDRLWGREGTIEMPGKAGRVKDRGREGERERRPWIENHPAVIKNDGELCLSTWDDVQNILNENHRFQNKTVMIPFCVKSMHLCVQINVPKDQRSYLATTKQGRIRVILFLFQIFM